MAKKKVVNTPNLFEELEYKEKEDMLIKQYIDKTEPIPELPVIVLETKKDVKKIKKTVALPCVQQDIILANITCTIHEEERIIKIVHCADHNDPNNDVNLKARIQQYCKTKYAVKEITRIEAISYHGITINPSSLTYKFKYPWQKK
jgi:hypothetical protein